MPICKKSIFYALIFSISLIGLNAKATNCPTSSNNTSNTLKAQYNIQTKHQNGKKQTQSLILWRYGSQVALEHPNTHIVELWEQTKNGQLRLVRYFLKHQRGIEYQPSEINNGKGENDWSLRRQLISNALINTMTLKKETTKNCQQQKEFSLKNTFGKQKLTWLSSEQLIQRYWFKTNKKEESWKLSELTTNKEEVHDFFSQLQSFQTTDYTDIGDNEADPFLQKMIHQGFIEHSHSGFYEAQQSSHQKNQQHDSHKNHEH